MVCNYCNVTLKILFNVNHLFAHGEVVTSITLYHYYSIQQNSFFWHTVTWFQVLLCPTKSSIKYQPFIYIQLNDQSSISNCSI